MFSLHENFMHILPTFWATNSKPNEYKKSTKWEIKGIILLVALLEWICSLQNSYILHYLIKCII